MLYVIHIFFLTLVISFTMPPSYWVVAGRGHWDAGPQVLISPAIGLSLPIIS